MKLPIHIQAGDSERVEIGVVETEEGIGLTQAAVEIATQMSQILHRFMTEWDETILGDV